jgi:RNA polymerase sigma-70 factor, ECF subfamily
MPDEEIVFLYKTGNKEIFKKLINCYTNSLYNFAARLTNKNEAEDIVQEVFIKVWKKINNFDPQKASFKTWIFTIAKNTATDFLRKKKNILFSEMEEKNDKETNSFEENIPSEDLLPDQALQKLQDSEFLNKTLEKLHPNYQEVLVLHYQEEMTFEEIGKVLNKPLNTVKSTHRRAIMELRKILY